MQSCIYTAGTAAPVTYYLIKNAQGDVMQLRDEADTIVANYAYDAFGRLLSVTDIDGKAIPDQTSFAHRNPLRYRGYLYDSETGFYYLSSRYYDPKIRRFINADSLLNPGAGVVGYNLFAYCNNNPVIHSDPSGTIPFLVITAAIGAVAGAVVGGIVAAKNGGNIWAGVAIGAATGALIGLGAGAAAGTLLAGSATAAAASVVTGAKAVASITGSVGIAAGSKMLIDNASQACSNTSQVFWSGGDVAKNAAKQVANSFEGKTLEMTQLGTFLEQINAPYSAWQAASSNFANVASNSSNAIYSIQNVAGINLQSTWATIEYPLLRSQNIIYGVVTQSNSIQIMP